MKDEDIKLPMLPTFIDIPWSQEAQAVRNYARQAVRMNLPQPKPSAPEHFDLARAMAGEPIVTRDGRKARFVAHVPEVKSAGSRVIILAEGDESVSFYWETGFYDRREESEFDLFMAPKPKRVVWVNVWGVKNCQNFATSAHESKERATEVAAENFGCKYLAIAHPIEIDA